MSYVIEGVRFETREDWGARPPKSRTRLPGPRKGNAIHYEGPALGDYPHASCATKVRGIQAFHMDSRGWTDIAYSTLTCQHGHVFECRGFGIRTAAQGTTSGNDSFHAHCALMGAGDTPTPALLRALATVVKVYRDHGSGPEVHPHSYFHATQCCGDPLRDWIREGMIVPPDPAPAPIPPSVCAPTGTPEAKLLAVIGAPENQGGYPSLLMGYAVALYPPASPPANAMGSIAVGPAVTGAEHIQGRDRYDTFRQLARRLGWVPPA